MSSLVHSSTEDSVIEIPTEHAPKDRQEAAYWENRKFIRSKCKIPIIYTYYNIENLSDEFKTEKGIAYNYSINGMYFENKKPLQRYLPIYIKMKGDELSISAFDEYEGHHAEVKWCNKQNKEFGPCYSIGIQFYEPLQLSGKNITITHGFR
jgi:hypothetical protein